MKIISETIEHMTIEEFADKHDLTMEVHERPLSEYDPCRYYAHFKSCEVKGDGVLIGVYGNGRTIEEAIDAYAKEISLKRIVINAMGPNRYKIDVPRLIPIVRKTNKHRRIK